MKTLKILISLVIIAFAVALSNWAIVNEQLKFLAFNILFISIVVCLFSGNVTQKISNLVQNLNN